jgi:hypothetical protein
VCLWWCADEREQKCLVAMAAMKSKGKRLAISVTCQIIELEDK